METVWAVVVSSQALSLPTLAVIATTGRGFIDLHMSVGKIYDMSTGKEYPVDSSFFRKARRLTVKRTLLEEYVAESPYR